MKAQNDEQRGAAIARPSEVYVRNLEPGEQQMIEELSHRTPDATIKTRCQIIVLEASPMRVPQIAQVIFYSEDTVARCIHECNQSRRESLLPSRDQRTPTQGHTGLLGAAALDHRARSQASSLCLLELDSPLACRVFGSRDGTSFG